MKQTTEAFTLIEVLLAVLLASVLGLCMANILFAGIKVNTRLHLINNNQRAYLMADEMLTKDIENAVAIDLSANYPDVKNFDGKEHALSFLVRSQDGIKRISYAINGEGVLVRQEMEYAHWLNGQSAPDIEQRLIKQLERDGFTCRYAAYEKDVREQGLTALSFKEQWQDPGLPFAVQCVFLRQESKQVETQMKFERIMFTSPVWEK